MSKPSPQRGREGAVKGVSEVLHTLPQWKEPAGPQHREERGRGPADGSEQPVLNRKPRRGVCSPDSSF